MAKKYVMTKSLEILYSAMDDSITNLLEDLEEEVVYISQGAVVEILKELPEGMVAVYCEEKEESFTINKDFLNEIL